MSRAEIKYGIAVFLAPLCLLLRVENIEFVAGLIAVDSEHEAVSQFLADSVGSSKRVIP